MAIRRGSGEGKFDGKDRGGGAGIKALKGTPDDAKDGEAEEQERLTPRRVDAMVAAHPHGVERRTRRGREAQSLQARMMEPIQELSVTDQKGFSGSAMRAIAWGHPPRPNSSTFALGSLSFSPPLQSLPYKCKRLWLALRPADTLLHV